MSEDKREDRERGGVRMLSSEQPRLRHREKATLREAGKRREVGRGAGPSCLPRCVSCGLCLLADPPSRTSSKSKACDLASHRQANRAQVLTAPLVPCAKKESKRANLQGEKKTRNLDNDLLSSSEWSPR